MPYSDARSGRRKEPRRIDDTASGRSCRRSSRMACRQGSGFAGSRQSNAGRSIRLETPETRKTQPGRFYGARGAILSAVDCRAELPADTPLFTVPDELVRILDRDLVAAGIARRVEVDGKWKIDKRDERGRTVDVHALRHTFGTLLSKGGVAPRTAQAAMRHSTIESDHEHLHRSEAVGRGRGDGSAAGAASRGMGSKRPRRPKCNRDRRFGRLPVCTRVCTNYRQNAHIAVNHGQDCKRGREIEGRPKPLPQVLAPSNKTTR